MTGTQTPGAQAPVADVIEGQLQSWATAHVPGAVSVTGVGPMPGNAGLSFGFEVQDATGAVLTSLVIRLSPPGVRHQGNTDVLRQVPLLEALTEAGLPIARLVWWTSDPQWFATDVIIQERLSAKHLPMHDPDSGLSAINGDTGPYLQQAAAALADLHRVDPKPLQDWDEVQDIEQMVAFWRRLLAKQPEPEWTELGEQLAERLLETDPGGHRIGIFHGDYQTHNILYGESDGRLEAIIDWEISGLGPVGLDVGWLAMMADPTGWHDERNALALVTADPAQVHAWYEEASGEPLEHFDFYQALACYRYGTIAGFNLRLHRTGRRVDAVNELTGPAAPALFRTGLRLLG